ncbi:PREDICTED: Fc receptor-like protein 3 isoform X1 [Ceratotherium simum simum]|uniref:Fc receptor-like protein 3 isoform X1 n=1 Tax=Ceratotherium simum simum TaxID=73337 RepID=A0ABM1D6S4_CERSS|nr:PREDICTED: Fc receptor-like protein 3 isoform X1 [Ceratotherium simum simum]
MLLWLLLLILAPGREQSGLAPKAFLLLTPSWTTNFKGEKVTLTCWDSHSPAKGDIYWYYNDNFWKKESGDLQINMSGYYKCKTQRSSFSDPVHVEFLSDWLILQASHPVFEGDNITLRCRGKKEADIREKIYYKDGEKLVVSYDSGSVRLNSISRISGKYHCTASGGGFWRRWEQTSKPLRIQVQELFPPPLLTASSSQPIEGNPVTLKCETWLPPQKSYIQLQFCFFREDKVLGSGWSSSPELQIPAIWSEDSRSYWCQAGTVTHSVMKRSLKSQIHVQRVPVSDVNIEMQPPGGQLIEGENLVLICSAAKGTGTITFSWHREGIIRSLGRKTQRSLSAELWIPTVKESDAGRYYCAADNFQGPILSEWITVTLRIPVSRPILTLRAPRAQAVVGDVVELHCAAWRGSPPILYQFYHEDATLGNSLAPSGGGASLNLSLTAEHSGAYSCEAHNGLGAQHSERVILNITVPVSRPVLTVNPAGAQPVVGELLELHCEAQRGSPPILYWFYHDNDTLGNSLAPFGGGASFNLSLMAQHSGNYSCGADNGLGVQCSEMVTLNFTGSSRNKIILITVGVIGGLLSILGLAATAALMGNFKTQRKSGGLSATGTPSYSPNECQEPSSSRPFRIDPQEPTYSEPPALMELQPVYSNVNPGDSELVYSQIWSIQHTKENLASAPRMHWEHKGPTVIYSELKKAHPDDSAVQASSRGSTHGDATENYENVPCASSALDH